MILPGAYSPLPTLVRSIRAWSPASLPLLMVVTGIGLLIVR